MKREREKKEALKKMLKGEVVKLAMKNTAVVAVSRFAKHPVYKKQFVKTKKYLVETSGKDLRIGQRVQFYLTKPLSKKKRWKIL